MKMKALELATTLNIDFSQSQGQITLQSRIESGRNSKSSEMLWLSLFLPSMKKIESKLKALEWPQHKILIFQTLKCRSAVRGLIWSKFELIRDHMVVLVTSKNKEYPNKK